jgi:hypothetical protein
MLYKRKILWRKSINTTLNRSASVWGFVYFQAFLVPRGQLYVKPHLNMAGRRESKLTQHVISG